MGNNTIFLWHCYDVTQNNIYWGWNTTLILKYYSALHTYIQTSHNIYIYIYIIVSCITLLYIIYICHGAHTREEKDTQTRTNSIRILLINHAGQRDRIHREVTSRPDEIKLKRQELNTQVINTHNHIHTAGHKLTHNDMKQGQETNQIWTQEAGTDDTHNITLT